MNALQEMLLEKYNLLTNLIPIGENERNNVFIGQTAEKSYIVKVEDIEQVEQVEQVKISICVASSLANNNLIGSSQYLKSLSGNYYETFGDKIITVQIKENLEIIYFKNEEDLQSLGEAVAQFHKILMNISLKNLSKSDFYLDFMGNEVPLAQTSERLEEINEFYRRHRPEYKELTMGVTHNDLNSSNIFRLEKKYFIIDFEHLKESPLISDLGVLVLGVWDQAKGKQDYFKKLNYVLKGYERTIKLSDYDKKNIIVFSLRYLFSDENWYTYWLKKGNVGAANKIKEIQEKLTVLYQLL